MVRSSDKATSRWPERLSWGTLVLALGLLLARGTMQEALREPFEATAGSDAVAHGPGPAASLGLDLLCCVPALLVLVRRVTDRAYVLRTNWCFLPLAALSAWMLLSTFWAADKFAALVTGFHWLAAGAMTCAAAQLVRSWLRLRLVAGVCFGLLLVFVAHSVLYYALDLPEMRRAWDQQRDKIMAEHGMTAGSHSAQQFDVKVRSGELFGFTVSPNTFGAELSLLLLVSTGLLAQRLLDRQGREFAAPTLVVGIVLGTVTMGLTRSKTAFATPVLGAIILLILWRARAWISRRSKPAFFAGVGIGFFAIIATIGHGVYHGTLPGASLAFRWHYWVGAARMCRLHPLLGVGWDNFGYSYLAVRLPIAPEEVKDPHNLLVRFVTELGLIGGVLAVAWLLRLWWDLTRPVMPPAPAPAPSSARAGTAAAPVTWAGPGALSFAAMVAGVGTLLVAFLAIDWAVSPVDGAIELMRRFGLGAALVIGATLVTLRAIDNQAPVDRPAPWLLTIMLVGLGMFLVHNLVDFSLFETGPMFLFAVLAGSLLGVRHQSVAGQRRRTGPAAIALALSLAAWFGAVLFLWAPTLEAAHLADAADEIIRTAPTDPGPARADHFRKAVSLLAQAHARLWGLNGEYAYRAAPLAPPGEGTALATQAVESNPQAVDYVLRRARIQRASPQPDDARVQADYQRALQLDPCSVAVRLEYADYLATGKTPADRIAARVQYRVALEYNDKLHPKENKRLSAERVRQVEGKIKAIGE